MGILFRTASIAAICTFYIFSIYGSAAIDTIFANIAGAYERTFTSVELCYNARDAASFSHYPTYTHSVFTVIALHVPMQLQEQICYEKPKNLIVAEPHRLNKDDVITLGGCEHPDIAIVTHPNFSLENTSDLEVLRMLADYVVISTPRTQLDNAHEHGKIDASDIWDIAEEDEKTVTICLRTHKPGLRAPRWQEVYENPHIRYYVTSTFQEKAYTKHHVPGQTTWIPGINLMTFVLLRGVYPHNDQIRRMLKNLRSVDHNDLVISNMIVQGRRLAPIDYKDPHRNARSSRCLRAAKKLFKRETRFSNPEKAISEYRRRLARKWW